MVAITCRVYALLPRNFFLATLGGFTYCEVLGVGVVVNLNEIHCIAHISRYFTGFPNEIHCLTTVPRFHPPIHRMYTPRRRTISISKVTRKGTRRVTI
jgi:hypothetical protein